VCQVLKVFELAQQKVWQDVNQGVDQPAFTAALAGRGAFQCFEGSSVSRTISGCFLM